MILLRSHLFNGLFYLLIVVMMVVGLPALVTRASTLAYAKLWARASLRLLAFVAGTRLEVRGTVPRGGALIAAKHQSFLETFALVTLLDRPTYVLKRELTWIPLFGWYLKRSGMLPIDRKAGARTFTVLNDRAAQAVADGAQFIIFPEGTRRPPGAPPAYKHGVAHLYEALGVPCTPVALDTGAYWPRRSVVRRPGTATIAFLDPVPAGLSREEFLVEISERIETVSTALLATAGASAASRVQADEPVPTSRRTTLR